MGGHHLHDTALVYHDCHQTFELLLQMTVVILRVMVYYLLENHEEVRGEFVQIIEEFVHKII
jgi:hypothetical protein